MRVSRNAAACFPVLAKSRHRVLPMACHHVCLPAESFTLLNGPCRLDPLEEGRLKVLRLPERRVAPPAPAFGLLPLVPERHPEVGQQDPGLHLQ